MWRHLCTVYRWTIASRLRPSLADDRLCWGSRLSSLARQSKATCVLEAGMVCSMDNTGVRVFRCCSSLITLGVRVFRCCTSLITLDYGDLSATSGDSAAASGADDAALAAVRFERRRRLKRKKKNDVPSLSMELQCVSHLNVNQYTRPVRTFFFFFFFF